MSLKAKDLIGLSVHELDEKLTAARQELLNFRFQVRLGQLDKPSRIKQARRDIARILTVKKQLKTRINTNKLDTN